MLTVTDIKRDQPGEPEFRARYDELIAARYGDIKIPEDNPSAPPKYDDVRFATGTVAHGLGTMFVQVDERLVTQGGGDPEITIHEEAFMIIMGAGNREPQAFTRQNQPAA